MNARRLGTILQRILTLSIASAGCGGIDVGGFEAPACKDNHLDYLSGLSLAEPADYLELRTFEFDAVDAKLLQTRGTKCGGASDKAACEAAIAAASAPEGFVLGQCVQICTRGYLVVNRGDQVTVLSDKEAMLALVAPTDNTTEAMLAAELAEYNVVCGDPERGGAKKVGSGFEVLATRITADCDPIEKTLYRLGVDEKGATTELESTVVESESGACIGRRPAALHGWRATGPTPLGAYWAGVAHLEAASIPAFATLHRELVHHRAPRRLARAAVRAIRDEARHALVTRRLAAHHGGVAPRPQVEQRPVRSLEEIAVENAVEGCVRETFGALVGRFQARAARDANVRQAMRVVARDELRHASLAWAVDAWIRTQLPAESLRRVDEARDAALTMLLDEAQKEPHPDLVREAGVPDARQATELARRFGEEISRTATV